MDTTDAKKGIEVVEKFLKYINGTIKEYGVARGAAKDSRVCCCC